VRQLWSIDVDARDVLGVYSFVALCINMWSQSGWDYLGWRTQFYDDTGLNCGFCGCDPTQFDVTVRIGNLINRTYVNNNTVRVRVEHVSRGGAGLYGCDIDCGVPDSTCPQYQFAMMELTDIQRISGNATHSGWGRIQSNCAFNSAQWVVGSTGRVFSQAMNTGGDIWEYEFTRT